MLTAKRVAGFGVLAFALCCTTPPAPTPPPQGSAAPSVGAPASPALLACPRVRPISLGAISGRFAYPSEGFPVLAVFAIRVDDPTTYRVLHTVPTVNLPSAPFTMSGVEPGTYLVLAYVEGGGSSNTYAGAYTPAVACGLRATCTDHSLIRVVVKPGETMTGVDVLDWYAPDGTFPARPRGSEPLRAGEAVRVCNPYADSLNVRASAGLGFPVRRTLDNGTAVAVRDGPLPGDGFDWYEVNLVGDPLASGWVVGYALTR